MSIASSFVLGALRLVASTHPELAPLINFAIAHESEIEGLAPIVAAAVKEGPGAFAAAKAKAPELTAAIESYVAHLRPAGNQAQHAAAAENVTRQLFGHAKMSPQQESDLMNRMTPRGDPSQENSTFGG